MTKGFRGQSKRHGLNAKSIENQAVFGYPDRTPFSKELGYSTVLKTLSKPVKREGTRRIGGGEQTYGVWLTSQAKNVGSIKCRPLGKQKSCVLTSPKGASLGRVKVDEVQTDWLVKEVFVDKKGVVHIQFKTSKIPMNCRVGQYRNTKYLLCE